MRTDTLNGHPVVELAAEGPLLSSERDATDLIGELYFCEATWVVVPVARLGPEFFRLRTGQAGAFIQKFMNDGRRLAFVGDLSAQIAASDALRDFVYESNDRGTALFARDAEELATLLR